MSQPRVIVMSGYGLNCEEETKFAFERAGGVADIVHINDLIAEPKRLDKYQIMAMPGGFSYGDDTGSGNAYANRLRNHLEEPIRKFVESDRLVAGICNGFQIISNLGLVPAINKAYGQRSVVLTNNSEARYIDRWVDLRAEGDSPWVKNLGRFMVPVAHGEGRLYADEAALADLRERKLVALRYVTGEACEYQDLPANPNGSHEDIAGVTDESGRILGLMPHPERAMFFTQLPHWPVVAERMRRRGEALPEDGPGLQLFRNAVKYFG